MKDYSFSLVDGSKTIDLNDRYGTGSGYAIIDIPEGLGMPGLTARWLTEGSRATFAGTTLPGRKLTLRLLVRGRSAADLRARVRNLYAPFTKSIEPTATLPYFVARDKDGYRWACPVGLDGSPQLISTDYESHWLGLVRLRSSSPYWRWFDSSDPDGERFSQWSSWSSGTATSSEMTIRQSVDGDLGHLALQVTGSYVAKIVVRNGAVGMADFASVEWRDPAPATTSVTTLLDMESKTALRSSVDCTHQIAPGSTFFTLPPGNSSIIVRLERQSGVTHSAGQIYGRIMDYRWTLL